MQENYIKLLKSYFKSGNGSSIYYTNSILESLYSKGEDNVKSLELLLKPEGVSLNMIKISQIFSFEGIFKHNVQASDVSSYSGDNQSINSLVRNDKRPIFIYTGLTDLMINYLGLTSNNDMKKKNVLKAIRNFISNNGQNSIIKKANAFKVIRDYYFGINNFFIYNIAEQFRRDIKSIYSVNPKATIMAFGVDNSDKIMKTIIPKLSLFSGISDFDKLISIDFITRINTEIKKICDSELSVEYMEAKTFNDVDGLAKLLSKKVGNFPSEPSKNYQMPTDNDGVSGILDDIKKQIEQPNYPTIIEYLNQIFGQIGKNSESYKSLKK